MTEEVLKNAIESTIGKNTVLNIRFSFRKKSFAFVTFKTSEAQQVNYCFLSVSLVTMPKIKINSLFICRKLSLLAVISELKAVKSEC